MAQLVDDDASVSPPNWWWVGLVVGFLVLGGIANYTFVLGPVLFLVAVIGLVVKKRGLGKQTGLLALIIAVAGNAFNLGSSLWFFRFPEGVAVRPMFWSFQSSLVGGMTVLSVSALAVHSFWRVRRMTLPLVAFVIAIASLFVGWQVLHLASEIRGFNVPTD